MVIYSTSPILALQDGEKWLLGIFVSSNEVDQIRVSSTCGSMSYCGTQDATYPDKRVMGFPFSTPITIDGQQVNYV